MSSASSAALVASSESSPSPPEPHPATSDRNAPSSKSIVKRGGTRRQALAVHSVAVPAKLQRLIVGHPDVPFPLAPGLAASSPRKPKPRTLTNAFSTQGKPRRQGPVRALDSSDQLAGPSAESLVQSLLFPALSPTRMRAQTQSVPPPPPPASPPRARTALGLRGSFVALQQQQFTSPLSAFASLMDSPATSNRSSSVSSSGAMAFLSASPNSMLPAFIGAFKSRLEYSTGTARHFHSTARGLECRSFSRCCLGVAVRRHENCVQLGDGRPLSSGAADGPSLNRCNDEPSRGALVCVLQPSPQSRQECGSRGGLRGRRCGGGDRVRVGRQRVRVR